MEKAVVVEERKNEFQLNRTSNYSMGFQNQGILILDTIRPWRMGDAFAFASRIEMTLDQQPECCDY